MSVARLTAHQPRSGARSCLLGCVLMGLLLGVLFSRHPVHAQAPVEAIGIYYVGPEDQIAAAIERANPYILRVDQVDLAQVIVINNAPLRESLEAFNAEIQQERVGLVLFCGAFFPQSIDDLRLLLGFSTFGLDQTAAPERVELIASDDALGRAITWRSAPELYARTLITNPNLLRPIVTTSERQGVIQRVRGRDETQALIVGGWMSHPANDQWQNWPYFDYLVYRLIADAADADRTLAFADYPRSPTPERALRWPIIAGGLGSLILAGALYYSARRRLYLRPNPAFEPLPSDSLLIASSEPSAAATPTPPTHPPTGNGHTTLPLWQRAGFHRPLAGFLAYLPLGLLLMGPLFIYRHVILPDVLFTDPLGYGAWQTVGAWTLALWTLLDAGMGVAAVRYYVTTHRHWPGRAPKYLQFYVWWQFLSGAVQVGLIALLSVVALPALGLGHLSYYLLAHALLQFPGFLQIFTFAFRARQRLDYEQVLALFGQIITPLVQVAFVLAFRPWGESGREFTPGISSAFGLVAGLLTARVLTFILGTRLYRRTGEPLGRLFLPTFDAPIARELLRFGVPWSVGAAVPALGAVAQILLFERLLSPASAVATTWRGLLGAMAIFEILLVGFYQGLMPALCEAATFRYKTLLRYYVSQAIRYGAWFSLFLFGLVSAMAPLILNLAPRFNLVPVDGGGPLQHHAWLIPLVAWGALRWAAWLPDRMLEAAGKPSSIVWLAITEEVLRIAGAYFLIRQWGFIGLPVAYVIALLVRILLGRWVSGRHLVKARIYIWQSLVAPAAAALSLYLLLHVLGMLLTFQTWQGGVFGAVGLSLPALLFYGFLTAMFGGWDDGSLAELHRAMRISSLGRPFAWLLYTVIELGARFSPLHNRFSIPLYEQAQSEAQALSFARSQEL